MFKKIPLVFAALLMAFFSTELAGKTLESGFTDPPLEARTRCFWWWLNGNVTEEAITRDLEEMKAKGFGGALIFDASSSSHRTVDPVPPGPMYGTAPWRVLFRHAVAEAHRLGLELGLNIQSGWNLGGPCVTADEAAKQLSWSEMTVVGPQSGLLKLPAPPAREAYYRDIAVLAYKNKTGEDIAGKPACTASSAQVDHPASNATDANINTFWVSRGVNPGEGPTHAEPEWLQLTFENPVMVGGVQVTGRQGYGPRICCLDVLEENGEWKRMRRFGVKDGKMATERVDAIAGKVFRLLIEGAYDAHSSDAPRNVQVAEWVLLDADGLPVEAMRSGQPVSELDLKAGFHELGGSAPDCRSLLTGLPGVPGEANADVGEILDLTTFLDDGGNLNWAVPEGTWTVLRFGYTLTGARVSTSSGDWQGPVLDYMSTAVLEAYWARNVQPLLEDIGPLAGGTLRFLHTDSWECGGMNWTPGFEDAFQKQRGYNPLPYLPVIAGKIIESRDASNRFLADFRKTIAECVAENHYAHFARMAHERGLLVHPESGGPHAGPLDGIRNLGLSDMPMGEFWVPSAHRPKPENRFFVKQAASAAHIYGRKRVAAEAFTSIGPHWEDVLWKSVKPSFDHEACAGLNLSFIHTFTCSPASMGMPGQEYFAGTHFNPNVTWWDMAAESVVMYMNRCQFLLQQGGFVADVCYYYGDHIPNIAQRKEADPAGALPGYDYDVLDETSLLQLSCERNNLVLASGMAYRLLVLPDHQILSLPALQKVYQLVLAGATVSGIKPLRTASLTGAPESEAAFQKITDELWGLSPAEQGKQVTGEGTVLWGKTAKEILGEMGMPADCSWEGDDDAFGFIHRKTDTADIYFLSNRSESSAQTTFSFRTTGKQPEFFDPLTGRIRDATSFSVQESITSIPVSLTPYGSLFVVFRKPWQPPVGKENFTDYALVYEVKGPWKVAFDPQWGGPATTEFPMLQCWTQHADEGIRHYSGTATYTHTFDAPEKVFTSDATWLLDLGTVYEIASVRLNGKPLGVLWTPPFRVDVTDVLQETDNLLEIAVVNNWPNRLIGDAGLPETERLTRTNVTKFTPGMTLTPSGLIGPVQLLAGK